MLFRSALHRGLRPADPDCFICQGQECLLNRLSEQVVAKAASQQAVSALGEKYLATKFHPDGEVWYSHSRLTKEGPLDVVDLDFSPFFDSSQIKKVLPVVMVESEIFHSVLFHIHYRGLPHAGVENTLREIMQSFHPIGNARKFIAHFKAQCSKCRIMLKRAVDLELADFQIGRAHV